jgi:hypothetical protein
MNLASIESDGDLPAFRPTPKMMKDQRDQIVAERVKIDTEILTSSSSDGQVLQR